MRVTGLPELEWTNGASAGSFDSGAGELVLRASAGVDWSNDSLEGGSQHGASMVGFRAEGDFALCARVRVASPRTTFDAAVLGLWADENHWAKLCFENSPASQPMVVSVVTNRFSDDCNSTLVNDPAVFLRVSRVGSAYAFHSSADGKLWDFVRLFRLHTEVTPRVGFMAQSPTGESCEATFDEIRYARAAPVDLRDGS